MQLDLDFKSPVSVSELTARIKDSLESGFPDVWVAGEITGLRIPSSGHVYFTLKDDKAQVRAVFFRMGARFLKFRPADGLEVVIRGRVTVYEPRGEYQVIVEYMEPKGLGALQLAFLQLKEKLGKEGLFDAARKRPLPSYPKRVGVVTSPTGAAIRDILKILKRRAPGVQVLIAPASVQGEAAPAEIAGAIEALNLYGGLDVIICGRGGGSMEDLAAFNTETVARAIYASAVPVISAVGHETDVTIADFVADLRAPTPSAAAELVAKTEQSIKDALGALSGRLAYVQAQALRYARSRLESEARSLIDPRRTVAELMLRLDDFAGRLSSANARGMEARRQAVRSAGRALLHLSPATAVAARAEAVTSLTGRLSRAAGHTLSASGQRLASAAAILSAMAPLAPLARGYAVARMLPGLEIIKEAARVRPGDLVKVELHKGALKCRVEEVLP